MASCVKSEMDYSKLRGKIREVYGTETAFATAMGYNRCTISAKLNNQTEWTRTDIEKACMLLGIPLSETEPYFFCRKSCYTATK